MEVIKEVDVDQELVAAGWVFLPLADLVSSRGVPFLVENFCCGVLEEGLTEQVVGGKMGHWVLVVNEPGDLGVRSV